MSKDSIHTFAIGDVHGRADLLEEMLLGIGQKSVRERFAYRIVFLGDIIDRGPESCRALDLVVETLRELPGSKLIRGNHDWFPLRILENEGEFGEFAYGLHWQGNGGIETLRSYGYEDGEITADLIRRTMGEEHLTCLRQAEPFLELDHHILVHAGLRPGVLLDRQDPYDLMWIRDEFLYQDRPFGKIVVHGHTITSSEHVEILPNRIAIDTGAYDTGVLSALQITPSGDMEVLEAVASVIPGICGFRRGLPVRLKYGTAAVGETAEGPMNDLLRKGVALQDSNAQRRTFQ